MDGQKFAEVLRVLTVEALDTLFDYLVDEECVGSARLTCRALRNAIDSSVRDVGLTVTPAHLQQWSPRQPPSLARWSRCTSLELTVDLADSTQQDDLSLASLAALPITGLPSSARKRFTYLSLTLNDPNRLLRSNLGSAIPILALLLPNLEEVSLSQPYHFSPNLLEQQLMYEALATVRHLDTLTLSSCRELACIGALATAGNLRYLTMSAHSFEEGVLNLNQLTQAEVAGLSQLPGLQRLDIIGLQPLRHDAAQAGLQLLLDSLPASLEHLQISWSHINFASKQEHMMAFFKDGRLLEIAFISDDSADFGARLAPAILRSRAMGPALRRVSFSDVHLAQGEALLQRPEVQSLRNLLGRSMDIRVLKLQAHASEALEAIEVFGIPKELGLLAGSGEVNLGLALWDEETQHEQVTKPADAESQTAALPSTADVARAVLRRLTAVPKEAAVGGGPDSGGGAAAGGGKMLLLRGSHITIFGQTPTALEHWMLWLTKQAAEIAAARSNADGSTPGGGKCVVAYQVLPPVVGAVLVECRREEGAAEALAAAVTAAAAMGQAAAGALELVPVAAEAAQAQSRNGGKIDVREAYLAALEQEFRSVWDGRHCADASREASKARDTELLRRLVLIGSELVSVRPAIRF